MSEIGHQLKYLALAYFHQDYDLDAAAPLEVIRSFRLHESPGAIAELQADLEAVLGSSMTESEIHDLWIREYGAAYDPATDGKDYRSWFSIVVDELNDS
jgi:hypothetical protein